MAQKQKTMHFSENLKFLRKRRQKSQMDLATELELTRTTLSGYEKNVQPPFRTLIKISEYFNISLDALIKYKLEVLSEFQLSQIEKGFDVDVTGNKLRLLTISVDIEGKENIEMVPLYLAKERPVVERNGTLIMVDDERMPLEPGETPDMRSVRFRTLGCYPLTGAVDSEATTLPEIIQEMLLATTSERQGRLIDSDQAGSMEQKKREGYF